MVRAMKRKSNDSSNALSQATITRNGKLRKTKNSVTKAVKDKQGGKTTTSLQPDVGAGGDSKIINLDLGLFKYSPEKTPNKVLDRSIEIKAETMKLNTEFNAKNIKEFPEDDDIFAQIIKAKRTLKLSVEGICRAVQPYNTQSFSIVHHLSQQSFGCRSSTTLKRVS